MKFKSNLVIGNQYTVDAYRDIAIVKFNFIDEESEAITSYHNNCPNIFCCDSNWVSYSCVFIRDSS